jgi:cell division protein FtsB
MGEQTDIERKVEQRLAHRWDWVKTVIAVLTITGSGFGAASYLFATSRTVDALSFRVEQLERDLARQQGDLKELSSKVDRIDRNVVEILVRLPIKE